MMNESNVEGTYSRRAKRWKLTLALLIPAIVITVIVSLNIGYSPIPFSEILRALGRQIPFLRDSISASSVSPTSQAIIVDIRLPRILAAVLIGAGLSCSGVLYQGIFKNPMADPYIIGVSSGAMVGAGVAIVSGIGLSFMGLPIKQTTAFIGALVTVLVVYSISRVGSKVPVMTLLLSGTAISSFLVGVFEIMQVTAPNSKLPALVNWLIGGISNVTWGDVYSIAPFIIAGIVISFFFSRDLNMIALGEDTAQHLGVNTERTKLILLVLGSMISAAAVSISGLIGFVGLMIPHITRLIVGPDHRILIPASVIVGAIYLVACDAVVRVATGVSQLPVGALTLILGGPFFIFLLRKAKVGYRM